MLTESTKNAPGQPGIPARWTTSAKSGVGTSLSTTSRVWFTLSHGILDEIYYPRVDQACTRDLGLIVTDGQDFFSEEKRHAEHVKLCRSLHDGTVFDMPAQTVQRYLKQQPGSPLAIWRFNHKCRSIPVGKTLRVEVLDAAVVHWSSDRWQTSHDAKTRNTDLGVHVADLPTGDLPASTGLTFTFYWIREERWEGMDHEVRIEQ